MGFIAVVLLLLAIMLVISLILKAANPPRIEARHQGFPTPWTGRQRVNSQYKGSQAPRPLSGRQLGTTPSQIGLLDQAQPQPMGSQRGKDSRVSRQLPAPPQFGRAEAAPFMQIQVPPAVRGQSDMGGHQNYTTGSPTMDAPAGAYRALPAPPPNGAPAGGMALAPVQRSPRKSQMRYSRGYIPLPEPPVTTAGQPYTDYSQPMQEYFMPVPDEDTQAEAGTSALRHTTSTRSRRSQQLERNGSQLSRVESIGAGDHRRHSRRLPQPKQQRMTTAERINALRTAKQDTIMTVDSQAPRAAPAGSKLPEADFNDLYAMDALQYPVRGEHRYSTHYSPHQRPPPAPVAQESAYQRYHPI